MVGYNDFATAYPDLLKEWDFEKNDKIGIKTSGVTTASGRKVWWKCKKGHEWAAVLNTRTLRGFGCPYCSGNKVIPGETDLETTHPYMLAKWDYTRNTISPKEIKAGSGKKCHWICINGHQWEKRVQEAIKSNKCPVCKE